MDPDERIRRREDRRKRRESEKITLEQEPTENKIRSSQQEELSTKSRNYYEQMTSTLEPEKNAEAESVIQSPAEEPIFVNDDDSTGIGENELNNNEKMEKQKEVYQSMSGSDSDAEETSVAEENGEPTENGVKADKLMATSLPKSLPGQDSSQTEPEALNVYKEMKMKKEQDESVKNALLELRMERKKIQEELEMLKKRKAERARQWEEADRIQQQHAEDRRRRQQEEEEKIKEDFEKQKREREIRMKKIAHNTYAYQAPKVTNGKATLKCGIRKAEALEREKKNALSERVPPLDFGPNPTKDRLRQQAQEFVDKLKTAYGKFFDLQYQTERSKYTIHELKARIKAMNKYSYERQVKASAGGLSNIVKQLEQAQGADGLPKSRLEREKQAGSILSSGGVKARLAMFGGGSLNQSDNNNEETQKQLVDLTK